MQNIDWTRGKTAIFIGSSVCQGCGACTVAGMSGAMDLKGFSNRQIIAEVDAICR